MKADSNNDKQFNMLIIEGVTRSKKPAEYLTEIRRQAESLGGVVTYLSLTECGTEEAWKAILSGPWSVIVLDGHHHNGDLQKPITDLDFNYLNEAEARIDTGLLIVGSCWSFQLRPAFERHFREGAYALLWHGICTYQHGFDVYPPAVAWALQGMPVPDGLESVARSIRGRRQIDLLTISNPPAAWSPGTKAQSRQAPRM